MWTVLNLESSGQMVQSKIESKCDPHAREQISGMFLFRSDLFLQFIEEKKTSWKSFIRRSLRVNDI